MKKNAFAIKITGILMAALGGGLLLLAVFTGGKFNVALPLIFFMLAGVFFIGGFSFSPQWRFGSLLMVPAALFCAFGLIFLLNILTGDWTAWAYAWLLLLAAVGVGLLVSGKMKPQHRVVDLVGWCLALGGLTFFGIFGVITGGLVIQIIAPLLLVAAGLSLRWLRIESVFKDPTAYSDNENITPVTETGNAEHDGTIEPLIEPLSSRELEVLGLIEQGLTNQQIAEALSVAPSTVKTHINNLYAKLGVQTRVQAINRAKILHLF